MMKPLSLTLDVLEAISGVLSFAAAGRAANAAMAMSADNLFMVVFLSWNELELYCKFRAKGKPLRAYTVHVWAAAG